VRIVHYPHPTLRHVSKPLQRVDAELKTMVRQMFDLMYEANGIGLAANQVDLPYRLFVMNITGDAKETEQEQVFINPVIHLRKGMEEAEEGCLSLPGIYADVKRPDAIRVTAYGIDGREFSCDLQGLAARAVQHEVDHLDGVLFIDRLSPTSLMAIKEAITELEVEFASRRNRREIPTDQDIALRLAELESART
jgi:peptide deformylase